MWNLMMLAVLCVLASTAPTHPQLLYDDESTPVGWAWARIRNDRTANFNEREECKRDLDPREKTGWEDECRQLPAEFLTNVLTSPKLRDQIGQHGVRLNGARIYGNIDLSDASVVSEVSVVGSRVEGALVLADSDWSRPLSIAGSVIRGPILAQRMRSKSILDISRGAKIQRSLTLVGSKFAEIAMYGSSFSEVEASQLEVGGGVSMRDTTFNGAVNLKNAKIGGYLDMGHSHFLSINAGGMIVGGNLSIGEGGRVAGDIDLRGARIGGQLRINNCSCAGLAGDGMTVGGDLFMEGATNFVHDIRLREVKVGGGFQMAGSSFMAVDIDGSTIGANLLLRNRAVFQGDVGLAGTAISNDLVIENNTKFLGSLYLTGTQISGSAFLVESSFHQVSADRLHVGRDFLVAGGTAIGQMSLVGAKIGFISFGRATASKIDLSEAVADGLRLRGLSWWCTRTGSLALHANDDETPDPREFRLEGAEG